MRQTYAGAGVVVLFLASSHFPFFQYMYVPQLPGRLFDFLVFAYAGSAYVMTPVVAKTSARAKQYAFSVSIGVPPQCARPIGRTTAKLSYSYAVLVKKRKARLQAAAPVWLHPKRRGEHSRRRRILYTNSRVFLRRHLISMLTSPFERRSISWTISRSSSHEASCTCFVIQSLLKPILSPPEQNPPASRREDLGAGGYLHTAPKASRREVV